MNFYILENINRLASNSYLEELFTKGKLQLLYEDDPQNARSADSYFSELDNDLLSFVVKYPNLKFNDFLFMRKIDVNSRHTQVILMLLKYGCDCLIYLDRSTLRWLINEEMCVSTLQRRLRVLEEYVEKKILELNLPLLKYNTKDEALNAGHIINMAFSAHTRNEFARYHFSGILIDVNFFFTQLLPRIKTDFTVGLLDCAINVFKANNDYCRYLTETGRLDKMKILYDATFPTTTSAESRIHLRSLYQNTCSESSANEFDKIVNEILNNSYEDLLSYEPVVTTKRKDSEPKKKKRKYPIAEINFDELPWSTELQSDRSGNVLYKNVSASIVFFRAKPKIEQEDLLKSVKKIMTTSCFYATVNKRFCVLLFYIEKNKSYRFMTRQIKTARAVLTRQNDERLICGWTGLRNIINKSILISSLKKMYNYKIKCNQIYNIDDFEKLIKDLTICINSIEGDSGIFVMSPRPDTQNDKDGYVPQLPYMPEQTFGMQSSSFSNHLIPINYDYNETPNIDPLTVDNDFLNLTSQEQVDCLATNIEVEQFIPQLFSSSITQIFNENYSNAS
ncbi:hypothetical protein [Drosophila suzukii associated hytrosavirus 1]|nr:hypothetical protein [Drosophila suzukii associated hytrosavirus 1]